MPVSGRLDGSIIDIQLEFLEREQTPDELMQLSIQLRMRELSFSNTVPALESFGVERARSTVHNWVQKANLQPTDGQQQDHIALYETVTQLDDQRY